MPTKVYSIGFDVTRYQQLCIADEDIAEILDFNGQPIEGWPDPAFYVANPARKRPDFWYVGTSDVMAFDDQSETVRASRCLGFLEGAGQWLPITVEDSRPLSILNVTEVVNALDLKRTRWLKEDEGRHMDVDRGAGAYVFRPERLSEFPLFRIPQNGLHRLFCCERSGDPAEEFKAAVEADGLTGLTFEPIWEA